MRSWTSIVLTLCCVAVCALAFALTQSVRSARAEPDTSALTPATTLPAEHLFDWLGLSISQRQELRQHDPQFGPELEQLRTELASAREHLALTLENTDSSEQAVEQAAERLIAADGALERRVTKYLLNVRDHLSPDQRRRLFCLAAEQLRQGRGQQWRHGQPSGDEPRGGGYGRGRRLGGYRGQPQTQPAH